MSPSLADLRFERPPELQAALPPELRGSGRDDVRLLVSTPAGHLHTRFGQLADHLRPGDLLVANRSATLPASLPAAGRPGTFRLNLSTRYDRDLWLAEPRWAPDRPGPLPLVPGERAEVAGLDARFVAPHPGLPRLWFVAFEGDLAAAMTRYGEPIRYAYLAAPQPLSAYQTIFGDRPGSAEMPSAGRPFTRPLLASLSDRRIGLALITLHAGVSSLEAEDHGEGTELERLELYAEPFEVSARTADLVNLTRARGGRVVAVGTTVVRALESSWDGQKVRPARGFTRRVVRPGCASGAVDGLLTGLHDPGATHLAMLYALAGQRLVRDGYREAVTRGYLWHEFGDSHLLLPKG